MTGRVCYHPCEGACHRGGHDGAVAIHAVERIEQDPSWRSLGPDAWEDPPTPARLAENVCGVALNRKHLEADVAAGTLPPSALDHYDADIPRYFVLLHDVGGAAAGVDGTALLVDDIVKFEHVFA